MSRVSLDLEVLYGFTNSLLSPRYDNPKPTPDFHFELWRKFLLPNKFVALAAPRGHAKSTAVTHSCGLASVLFMLKSNVMIIADTQDQSKQFLHDIKVELSENAELIDMFDIKRFVRDRDDEIIMEMGENGHQFRIFAKGAEQSLRGSKWRGKRPDLILADDMENDEAVMSKERREKLAAWFLAAVVPMLSDNGQIRVVGTILHSDGLLQKLLDSVYWESEVYEAHNDDFSEILWPEKFPKEELIKLQEYYIEQNRLDLYNMEYRNIPMSEEDAIFRKRDLLPITDYDEYMEYYVGADLAISKDQKADYTVFSIFGLTNSGKLKLVDLRRGRYDSLEIIDEVFSIQSRYKPELFIFEDENIQKAIGPVLNLEMMRRNQFIHKATARPSKDILVRCRSIAARIRAGGVEFDHEAEWYPAVETELTRFPRAKNDDIVSSMSLVGMKLAQMAEADETSAFDDFDYEDDDELDDYDENWTYGSGQCHETGY